MEAKAAVTAKEASTGSSTLADLLTIATSRHTSSVAFKHNPAGQWLDITYEELGQTVRELALGLASLGVGKGDGFAILSDTRPEWCIFDFAALCTGAIVVPIYQTNSAEECEYVLDNSESVAVVVESAQQRAKIEQVRGRLPQLKNVITMEKEAASPWITVDELRLRGRELDAGKFERMVASVGPDDICTIIYTSGTTGPPKGCVATHGNYRKMLDMLEGEVTFSAGEVAYLYLPLAHGFARLVAFISLDLGATLAFFRSIDQIIPDLMEVQPTYFPSVPRMFEKIYTMATSMAETEGEERLALFNKAVEIGKRVRKLELEGKRPEGELAQHFQRADEEVFQKVRAIFGGKLKTAVTGAAPISKEILEFFWACGVLVLEAYGMTETSVAATANSEDDFKFGTVGKPIPGCEIKIAYDGEILIKGPNIFQGYWKNDSATAETIVDGWLHTGDIGEIDEDGFLKITGRKKEIIITAGGKNISPANIENALKESRFISQAVVHGDRRPFLSALITLDPEETAAWASEHGLASDKVEGLCRDPQVLELVQGEVDRANQRFARVEQIKKFTILPHDLTQETGELTPTLKVKRNVVYDKYAAQLDAMY